MRYVVEEEETTVRELGVGSSRSNVYSESAVGLWVASASKKKAGISDEGRVAWVTWKLWFEETKNRVSSCGREATKGAAG